jgi:hypothetical protein
MFERYISTTLLVTAKFTFVDILLRATLAKKWVVAFISKCSKGKDLVLVSGIARLCTLILLSPSEDV